MTDETNKLVQDFLNHMSRGQDRRWQKEHLNKFLRGDSYDKDEKIALLRKAIEELKELKEAK